MWQCFCVRAIHPTDCDRVAGSHFSYSSAGPKTPKIILGHTPPPSTLAKVQGTSSYYSIRGDHDHTDDHRMTRLLSSGHPSVTPQSPPGQTSCVRRKVIASYDNLSPCPSHNMWVFCLWVTMNSVNFFAHTDRSFSSVADKSTSIAGQGCFAQYQMYVLVVDVMYRRSFYLYGVGRDPQPEREWSREIAYKFHYYYYC